MELEKIREFATLGESLQFTRAARELHISQSSLSRHVQELEDEVGTPLILRGTNGGRNTLTPAGMRFLALVVPWLAEYDAILDECRAIGVRVAPARIQRVNHILGLNAQVRRAFETQGMPWVANFSFVDIACPAREALDRGLIEFAVQWEPRGQMVTFANEQDYGWVALEPEPLCFVASADSSLVAPHATRIGLDEVARARIVTIEGAAASGWEQAAREIFAACGCRLSFVTVPNTPGDGGAFPVRPHDLVLNTRRSALHYQALELEDVRVLEVEGFTPAIHPFLVYRRDTTSVTARQIVAAMT